MVALVVGVRDEGDACGEQFRSGGFDEDPLGVVLTRDRKTDAVIRTVAFAVLEFGLSDGGAERHVPQGRRLGLVRLTTSKIAQEGQLACALGVAVDGLVGLCPVDAQAHPTPQFLERLLVLNGQALAERDEVAATDRYLVLRVRLLGRLEVGVVRQRRIAANSVVVLHTALGWQAVVVPAHRVEDLKAAHALVAGHAVGVGVGENVPDVQRPAHRRRGSVDRVHLVAGLTAIEPERALLLPDCRPFRLDAIERWLVRHRRRGRGGKG